MATVVFAWECGGGLGHLHQMAPLADELVRRGHHVSVALRHLSTATAEAFGRVGVSFFQAPFRSAPGHRPRKTFSFCDVLSNVGWVEQRELFALAYGWRNLMDEIGPDVVVFDHAPTALLQAGGWRGRRNGW